MNQPSYADLKKQAEELLKQAEAIRTEEKKQVISDIKSKIVEYQIDLSELGLGGAVKKGSSGKRGVVAPKYRDTDSGQTWTGRGQAPKWLRAKIESGAKKEEFLIDG